MATASAALITGGTAGIGHAFARALAAKGRDLVLVARQQDRLTRVADELQREHGVKVLALAEDLSMAGATARVTAAVDAAGVAVDMLVNNAATLTFGELDQVDAQQELSMLQLNVITPVELTRHFLGPMKARRRGTIFFLSGALAYLPMPYHATYRATKSFLAAFGDGVRLEAKSYGVEVVTLFPWLTTTAFQETIGVKIEDLDVPFRRTPEEVVASALASVGKRSVVRDSAFNRLVYGLTHVLPEAALMKVIKPPREP